MEKEFGSKALSESYEQLTYIYPLEKVEVGDSWQNKYTGNLIADNTWKLAALTDGIATISGTGDVTNKHCRTKFHHEFNRVSDNGDSELNLVRD